MTSNTSLNGSLTAKLPPSRHNGSSRTLSRSPHPYHRRGSSLNNGPTSKNGIPTEYGESSDSTESEERGTEADDEKGPILKGLPAPPLHGRKGLKGSKTPLSQTPAISPVPTPPASEDRRSSYFNLSATKRTSKTAHREQEVAVEAYKKYVRRRHAEIARRSTEAILLAFIAIATTQRAVATEQFGEVLDEVHTSCAVLVIVYLLFPIRIAFRKFRHGDGLSTSLKAGFHIPSRFDPGPLLYPVLLPFLISVSCMPTEPIVIVANLILGIASLPQKVIPFGPSPLAENVHWTLSIIPLISHNRYTHQQTWPATKFFQLDREALVLLFPLHRAVLATLKYLTSTSLDPAEIQLLSTALIDLLLFAVSPQAEILKALLWVGPLCLFLSCQKPLSWEVRLARVPSWKFARNKSPRKGFLGVFGNVTNMLFSPHRYKQSQGWSSDDEDYEHLKLARRMAKNQLRLRKVKTSGTQSDFEPIPSEREMASAQNGSNALRRSQTTLADGSHALFAPRRHQKSINLPSSGLLSLTYTQAQACKWLISGYVFATVFTIILVVVRWYVSSRALSSHEPFGWAIGYLFGDIRPLRLWVVSNNLDSWISLPGHVMNNVVDSNSGWVESIRQIRVGPANFRLLIGAYSIAILTAGISIVLSLGDVAEVDTRRKVFHGIMVAMLLPTIFVDPCFTSLAVGLILAIFLLLDLLRASQLPPVSKPLTTFLAPYVDGRDYRGPVIVSHIFLLIGCAIPLWLSLAAAARTGYGPWVGWDTNIREISMISGVVCVGLGDAAASLIGRRYGKTKWFWGGGKSLEGSLAFAVAVTVGLSASYAWLRVGGWADWRMRDLPLAFVKMMLASSGASILESVLTAGNDNVIVPIGLWLLTRGLEI